MAQLKKGCGKGPYYIWFKLAIEITEKANIYIGVNVK